MPPLIGPRPDAPAAGSQAGSQTHASTNPAYGSLWSLFQAANAGQTAAAQSQQDLLQQQLGLTAANFGMQSGQINQDLASQLAQMGLQGQGRDIQQGALNRQAGLLPQQYALQQQQYGLQGQGLDAAAQQAQQQADVQNRGAWSSATSRGATNTLGHTQQLGDIGNQLQQALGGIDRSRQGLGIQQQQSALSNKEQQAQLADQQKNLDLLAKQQGISSTDVKQRAQRALEQLGLTSALNVNDITQAMVDSVSGQFNPISQFLGIIYQLSGLRPPTGG